MIPDILNYLFTGCMVNEPSELSTTQLMDARKRELSEEALKTMEIPSGLFAPIGRHGTAIGTLHSNVKEILGISYDVPVICVPSHDTAAAVLAIPAGGRIFVCQHRDLGAYRNGVRGANRERRGEKKMPDQRDRGI